MNTFKNSIHTFSQSQYWRYNGLDNEYNLSVMDLLINYLKWRMIIASNYIVVHWRMKNLTLFFLLIVFYDMKIKLDFLDITIV